MNARIIVAAVSLSIVTGGLVAPALASPTSPKHRDKVCVDNRDWMPDGYCVVVDDAPLP